MESQYKPTPDGLVGNDDLGQMSAWFVFTAMGFYPVAPGSNEYVIGRPFLHRTVLHLPNGKVLTIAAENLSKTNSFVVGVTLNGKPLDRTFLRHNELMGGGELRFVMGLKEHATWSQQPHGKPFSMTAAR